MFEKLLATMFGFLKVSSFAKDENGKSILSAEQKQQLTEKYGEKFVQSFEKDLELYESDGKSAEGVVTKELLAEMDKDKEKNAKELKEAKERISALEEEKKQFQATIESLGKKPVEDGGAQVEGGTDVKTKFKLDMNLVHNKYIDAILKGKAGASYGGDTTIDTQELKTEFGRYISSEKMEIFRSLLGTTTSLQYMTTVITDKFKLKASSAHITSVLQSFVPHWTPKGKTTFTPLWLEQFPMKINVEVIPSDIIDEVLGYMYDESLEPSDMPIVKYIVENLVKPVLDEERETAFAVGRYKEPVPDAQGNYSANGANQTCNGYLTQLCDIKKGGNKEGVNFIFDGKDLGTGGTLLTNIEAAVDEVKAVYKNKTMFIHCDPDLVLKYSRAYRDKYPNSKNEDGEKIKVDYTNFSFAPLEGMRGKGAFFITPKENFRHIISRNPQEQKLRMKSEDYSAKIFGEWREGVGFWIAEAIFAYIPAALVAELSPTGSTSAGGGL